MDAVFRARRAIAGTACRTPLVEAPQLGGDDRTAKLKLETAQPVGSFKLRGAANALAALSEAERARGVVCASTGNHGRALAYAAAKAGAAATVCVSKLVPANKLEALRAAGAAVRIVGASQDDAQAEVDRLVTETGAIEIPPFDHADIIAGQATIGLEIIEDDPDIDTVIVPLSGGGLIAGVAMAVKALSPGIRVIGVSPARGAAMQASLAAGRPVAVTEEPTLADSLGGGIGLSNRHTFHMVRDLVDEVVLLSEVEIAAAMRALFLREGWVAEGAGAVGVALLLDPSRASLGQRTAVVVSGRNIDMALFQQVIAGSGANPEAVDG
ncbi:MAG: hydroxyectoine utilization dehydratase EutB [Xanthobacteraceae bacterium]|jgi:threonine dehydratase|nr:hydroxyectoine utilization dehydratase EutB [Xanthobacteraceae bacterium]